MNERKHTDRTIIILAVLILLLAFVHAKTSVHDADFGPLNGTFQDFNPIRRLLSGQIPFRDFSDYLGLGHLYLGSLATLLFGGTFFASKTAFVFLAFLSLALIAAVLGTAVFRSAVKGLSAALLILSLLLIRPLFLVNSFALTEILSAFDYALKNGNSARMVRAFILPLVCAALTAGFAAAKQRPGEKKLLSIFILCSFFSGFALPWSNDYGISVWLCLLIMIDVTVFARTRSFLKTVLLFPAAVCLSLLGAVFTAAVVTLGNLPGWLRTTFGIGGFQGWYPNTVKHFYIFNIDLNSCSALQAILCLCYIAELIKERGKGQAVIRYGIPCLANMTGFCAMNEYYMISGDSAREVGLIILTLTVIFEVSARLLSYFPEATAKRSLLFAAAVCAFTWLLPAAYEEFIYQKLQAKPGTYIPEMGGRVTELGGSLLNAKTLPGEEKVFSTYASAVELVTGQFQPSGTDYIIHVMGDENRAAYLDDFSGGDFRYSATIKETFSPWEYYVRRSNWYFYRELYRSWHPVSSSQYQLFWERNEAGEDHVTDLNTFPITVSTEQNEPTKVRIMIRTDESVTGFADLAVDYTVNKNGTALSRLMFQRMLYVSGDKNSFSELPWYETNYLRAAGREHIPVSITDGYGEILLSSVPQENTNLTLNSVSCEEIFTVPFRYAEVTGAGYYGEAPCLKLPKIPLTKAAVSGKNTISVGPYDLPILGTREDDDNLLLLVDLSAISFADLEQAVGSRVIAGLK